MNHSTTMVARAWPVVLLVVIGLGVSSSRAWADGNLPPGVDGCTIVQNADRGISRDGSDLPVCANGQRTCYECCVTERDQSGWKFCVIIPNTDSIPVCSDVRTEFPPWWPDPNDLAAPPAISWPSDLEPPQSWPDDGGALDLGDGLGWSGGSGGGGHGCLHQCPPAYGPTKYAALMPPHPPYIP
jgi:hypothetical protein